MSSSENAESTENDNGHLRATISQEYLSEFVDGVQPIVDECRLHIGEDGIRVHAVDAANAAVVKAGLNAEAFQSYDADDMTVGFPFYRMQDLLEHFPDGKPLDLQLIGSDELRVSAGHYTYRLNLMEPEKLRSPPDGFSVDITADVTLDRNVFFDAIDYFREFASHVTIGFNSGSSEFWMTGDGDRVDDRGEFVLAEEHTTVQEGDNARSKYSLDYLRDFRRGSPEYGSVTVRTGEEVPMTIRQQIAPEHLGPEDAVFRGELVYVLAPRIGDN